ncbi:hypothetical protein BTVI_137809 [Pitangus sulphuratus]|nr:hypothetical protein BTVI_137809 [Pitangus sulphuratus]
MLELLLIFLDISGPEPKCIDCQSLACLLLKTSILALWLNRMPGVLYYEWQMVLGKQAVKGYPLPLNQREVFGYWGHVGRDWRRKEENEELGGPGEAELRSFVALLASRMENCGNRGTEISSSACTLLEYLNEVTMAFSYGLNKYEVWQNAAPTDKSSKCVSDKIFNVLNSTSECRQEEEMPEVEIDIDDLLDAANEEERALKLQVAVGLLSRLTLAFTSNQSGHLQETALRKQLSVYPDGKRGIDIRRCIPELALA